MIPLALWGASGHARVVLDAIRLQGIYQVVAVLDDRPADVRPGELEGVPVIGGREKLDELRERGIAHVMLGFGDCGARLRLADIVGASGFSFAVVVHPRSVVASNVSPGAGSFVAAGAVINPGARIGRHVIVNTSASVDHDCVIGDGAHISPGVHLAGGVSVGRGSHVGIGSSVRDGIRIGDGVVIGAGAVVVADIPDHTLAYGVPARVVSTAGRSQGST